MPLSRSLYCFHRKSAIILTVVSQSLCLFLIWLSYRLDFSICYLLMWLWCIWVLFSYLSYVGVCWAFRICELKLLSILQTSRPSSIHTFLLPFSLSLVFWAQLYVFLTFGYHPIGPRYSAFWFYFFLLYFSFCFLVWIIVDIFSNSWIFSAVPRFLKAAEWNLYLWYIFIIYYVSL